MKRYILYIIMALMSLTSQAQIRIGGDVYGGGKEGAVCVGNTSATSETAITAVTLTKADSSATSVIIAGDANVRTVFGGGRNGRVYGQTNVTVEGGTVGAEIWNNTIHGGVFGAGDGATAYVFGKQNSTIIKGGTIYNNVYGGGNQADLMGTTCVTLQGGLMKGSVFGGARMANIFGYSYVNLDGANVADDSTLVVPKVYGGNDISGNIATGTYWAWTQNMDMPFESILTQGGINLITSDWDAFVHATAKKKADDSYVNNIFVGEVFGGGNGDYEYDNGSLTLIDTLAIAEVKYTAEDQEVIDGTKNVGDVKTPAVEEKTKTFTGLIKPEVKKAYLDIQNGTYGNLYGGGNNATVTESVDICLFQQANKIVSTIPADRISEMGLSEDIFEITGDVEAAIATPTYQFDRVFGGNNKAEMKIRPNWYLARGTINSLYSGGNMGAMTASNGLILPIASDGMYVNNCFGGCRMADVRPQQNGSDVGQINQEEITSYKVKYGADGVIAGLEEKKHNFEAGYAARVFVMGGHIDNVYGGNDISGKVYFGTNVAINGAVSGNVYGGGNGSYAYTDKITDSDYYYDVTGASSSIDALNAHRPHVENTLVHIWGDSLQQPVLPDIWEDASNYSDASNNITTTGAADGFSPVIVTGGVYCGGNSATLEGNNAKATFKIGKNVIINSVFLGSNGEDMVTTEMLAKYKDNSYSTLDLTASETFEKYMSGCAVDIRPTITYDWKSGEDPHTYIGSLFGGGNVGSVTYAGPVTIDMPEGLKIYNHVVGGCNNANVPVVKDDSGNVLTPDLKDANDVSLDMAFEGGFITANSDATKPKVTINMNSYLEPRKLEVVKSGVFLESAKLPWSVATYFQTDTNDYEGNRVAGSTYKALESANVYGGCYTSGIIKGNVTVNITHDLVSPAVFNLLTEKNTGDAPILNGWTADKEFKKMGSEAMTNTMLVYGGGYGEETTIDGDVHVNLSGNARTICVLGGAEEGDITGSTYVTAAANMKDYTDHSGALPFNSVAIYAGAYAGPIEGHTELRLNGGTFLNAFGGSCNADIEGYASAYIGDGQSTGYPFIKGYVFGGNDFGGYIKGYKDYTQNDPSVSYSQAGYNKQTIRSPRYVEYNSGRIGDVKDSNTETALYGGSFGSYDYTKYYWSSAVYEDFGEADYAPDADGVAEADKFHFPVANETVSESELPTGAFVTNTYVNILCQSSNKDNDVIKRGIFGGGRGVMDKLGIVDTKQTYVYLHGATWAQRAANLCADIYGGGYYSVVENTKVDLESGCTGFVYGGSYGTSAANLNTDTKKTISYNSTRTEVNLYNGMDNGNTAIFGGGGYAGATDTYVNLYGGKAKNVYGGSYNEGFCQTTHVNVPNNSTASVNAIFGGGFGNDVTLPCDEETTNIDWKSSTAYVADMIYGGNNAKRAAKTTNINIYTPVKKSADGNYVSIFGAGNGESTVAGFTNINLYAGARVNNVYGGGRDGKVFSYYQNITGAPNYYKDATSGTPRHDFLSWTAASTEHNTNIVISQGATATNAYGAGYGNNATVAGNTLVQLNGGLVTDNIFGGGENGNVLSQRSTEKANESSTEILVTSTDDYIGNVYTSALIKGGQVNTVYGGGYNGRVGTDHTDHTSETKVVIGIADATDHYNGVPNILRGVYGGGYKGAIYGTANITMYNGYIGYDYVPADGETPEQYTEHLAASAEDTHELLKESGNIFGGGYGEGATTDKTIVNMYDGVIRNSLYGGGEIASVGVAVESTIDMNDRTKIPDIKVAGSTEVNMYGGLVSANVFGGGRGYAIDAYGNTQTGEKGYSDGYTFGKTRVNIYRGTVGTDATLEEGAGNVFGGGNIGYVYAADERLATEKKNVYKSDTDGYYHTEYDDKKMTEDSKVVVTPWARVTGDNLTIDGYTYTLHDLISREELDKITDWRNIDNSLGNLDNQGVIIRNAIFAGGNVSSGSDKVYANAVTIYGNSTASVIDCLNKDLVTIGNDGTGGLYGDGNLTFVDGYRELNITNYGTDYYNLDNQLSYEAYQKLNDRERAYFELKYECIKEYGSYTVGNTISGSDYENLSDSDKTHWVPKGFCTLYAGRMMNTIQRADFCGVFGSRMVLKGAQDRVPLEMDYTDYSLNRVGELSLNKGTNQKGNYFGIYNVVNYLGALTSDVVFTDTRESNSDTYKGDGTTSYYTWKSNNIDKRYRNNGTSKNKVALASGVWLELIKQLATGDAQTDKDVYNIYTYAKDEKIYGPITGVVELDILNAATGEGGGYVYALNMHGEQKSSGAKQTTLTDSNDDAVSYKQYRYEAMDENTVMETSGNFVNGVKQIIDDCYPYNGKWLTTLNPTSKAHYWFVRGNYYVYDQYISAYTGATMSYAESVNVPLTITAEANGKLLLKNVQQNLNAYWTDDMYQDLVKKNSKYIVTGDPSRIIINGNTYHKNTPISYWDWTQLNDFERTYFTTNTYVCTTECDGHEKGQVLTSSEYEALTDAIKANFNVTNAISAENGFLLTYDWDNPGVWSDYYIKSSGHAPTDMILATKKELTDTEHDVLGPSFHCTKDKTEKHIYGQTSYNEGDVVDEPTVVNEPNTDGVSGLAAQASFEAAYVAKDNCSFTITNGETTTECIYVKGSAISTTFYNSLSDSQKTLFEVGYTCTTTYQVSDDKYYISGDVITSSEYNTITTTDKAAYFSPAYICTGSGAWGGKLYSGGANYPALDVCSLPDEERKFFVYNLDAFETLIANSTSQTTNTDNYVTSAKYNGLDNYAERHNGLYAKATAIDFVATYKGSESLNLRESVTPIGESTSTTTITTNVQITNTDFDNLTNEKSNYSEFSVTGDVYTYYIVTSDFWIGEKWQAAGTSLTEAEYNMLSDENKNKVTIIDNNENKLPAGQHYYCKTNYTPITTGLTPETGTLGSAGSILNAADFGTLINEQADFEISGSIPTETSTLFVNSHVPIDQLNEDKIVTVIYEYSYIEGNESNTAFDNVKERHIVNIHIHFESGRPTVGVLLAPPTVLPGSVVGLNQPSVSKGAYEVLGGGWEIYSSPEDAETHKNGIEYTNNNTKMYWYQDGYQVAYYAKSYLGKTYSNSVPITVGNYHRMADVMSSQHDETTISVDAAGNETATTTPVNDYMYLNTLGKRNAKVYIKDATELDKFAEFFGLTKEGAAGFENIGNCYSLDFILDGDIDHSATSWTSIGNADACFSGNFHGDGHTISGLTNSLFGKLCGNVYNTGVTGTFTGSGITDAGDGKVYNCWVVTTGDVQSSTSPIHGGTGTVSNSYYYNNYGTRDGATQKDLRSFVDGEVAYRLNSYYLNGRTYADENNELQNLPAGYDNYVETRYGNEDFIYADGVIPQTSNIRKSASGVYSPIFPDDYIFFGQKLTYGIATGADADSHVDHPEPIKRQVDLTDESKNTKLLATDAVADNRVFRVPGYYQSKTKSEVFFNRPSVFVGSYSLADGNIFDANSAIDIYSKLTAIDFTGLYDQNDFDYDGLSQFTTSGLTRNLLVYADPVSDHDSYAVLKTALPEATLTFNADGYKSVAIPTDAGNVKGHLIDLKNADPASYQATRNHYLVDKEVFNCPISYTFGKDDSNFNYFMWYQRRPDNYVDASKGWEAISLPFTADLVSTQTKGEITHFYHKAGSNTYDQGYDSGHEYWLREFKGQGTEPATPAANTFYAAFNYPSADASASNKDDANTFLWDYYYSHDDNAANNIDKDKNEDDYQNTYYNSTRTYANYPLYTAAKPYIIGFPGSRYYEFDLSGTFIPQNRKNEIEKLDPQTISFVSVKNATIKVSDDEITSSTKTEGDYSYIPNYMDKSVAGAFMLNNNGSSFDKTSADMKAVPFRPYFTKLASPAPSSRTVNSIVFTSAAFEKGITSFDDGNVQIYNKSHDIYIENGTSEELTFQVTTLSGIHVCTITVGAHSQEVTRVNNPGVYLVGRKKLFVK